MAFAIQYQLVSNSFVDIHGIMDGEVIEQFDCSEVEAQELILC